MSPNEFVEIHFDNHRLIYHHRAIVDFCESKNRALICHLKDHEERKLNDEWHQSETNVCTVIISEYSFEDYGDAVEFICAKSGERVLLYRALGVGVTASNKSVL